MVSNALLLGWLNLIGQICGSASSSYGASQMLLAAVSIGSDFTYYPTQVCLELNPTGLLRWTRANLDRVTSSESWPLCLSSMPRSTA